MSGGPNRDFAKLRLLVAIASFGEKNLPFLREIIRDYKSLPIQTELVVVTDARRQICEGIQVIAGLPSKNPHSLPFARKAVLAENVNRFDLFIYSEDDI